MYFRPETAGASELERAGLRRQEVINLNISDVVFRSKNNSYPSKQVQEK